MNTITILKAEAEKGNLAAQNALASSYYHGTGVPKSFPDAIFWWHRAADQGSGEAFSMLGTMSYLGTGVPKDSTEAVRMWLKGAEKYDSNAQSQLGYAYLLGDSVPRNFTMAYMWFNLASIEGDKAATVSRDSVAQSMSADMVSQAQQLGAEWIQKHPKPVAAVVEAPVTPVAISAPKQPEKEPEIH